jgi:hypothetical protein
MSTHIQFGDHFSRGSPPFLVVPSSIARIENTGSVPRFGLSVSFVVIAVFLGQWARGENTIASLDPISNLNDVSEQKRCEQITETLRLIEDRERRLVSGRAVFSVGVLDDAWGVLPARQIEEIGDGLIVEYDWKSTDEWTVVLRNLAQDEIRRITSEKLGLLEAMPDGDTDYVVDGGDEDDAKTASRNGEDDTVNWPKEIVRAHLFPATREPGASISQWRGTFELLDTDARRAGVAPDGQRVLRFCYYLTVPSELTSLLMYESRFHMLLDKIVPWGMLRQDAERRAARRDEFALEVDIDLDDQYPIRMGSKTGATSALGGCDEKWTEPYAIAPRLFVPRKYVRVRSDPPRSEVLRCELLVDRSSVNALSRPRN